LKDKIARFQEQAKSLERLVMPALPDEKKLKIQPEFSEKIITLERHNKMINKIRTKAKRDNWKHIQVQTIVVGLRGELQETNATIDCLRHDCYTF